MLGGTTYHLLTDGIHAAVNLAFELAQVLPVRVVSGLMTMRQDLPAGLIYELHLTISTMLLGKEDNLFTGRDLHAIGAPTTAHVLSANAAHIFFRKRAIPHPILKTLFGKSAAAIGHGVWWVFGIGHPTSAGFVG